MLLWLLDHFAPLLEQLEFYASGDSRVFLTARIALASVTAFLMSLLIGPFAIRWLKRRCQERIASDSDYLNELQADKDQTPTMGGLFIVASIVMAILMWGDLSNTFTLLGLFTVVSFGTLGAFDDWTKLSTTSNGIRARKKMIVQSLLAAVISGFLYMELSQIPRGLELIWPVGNSGLFLGIGFCLWAVFVMVGSSNAVNLTDGLDGLATGCSLMSGAAFAAIAYLAGHKVLSAYLSIPYIPGSGEIAIMLGALVGALLGFLWFNCYPAQVFMGDTGSLAIGSLLAFSALVTRQEILLVVIGGVFVIETLSVILQVGWFRMTGRRLIRCSPLHNHFLFKGDHEIKIVVRFWIGAAILAIVGMATLKIR
ncbi:MAG: phospho-N-acetylmuramoyl-pentapeptide-transferase [Planctomycetaceae bacterium]|jgi:phospho-N-acetylmuramoyl-pentapeptide-transferase|nr:phospho-N-acetylmuramoyl-pentapeptide-transferase [Planctomycetaceae bacterium]MDG2389965.1 phospho-N-acetylmuramoyl-pentapeptide-transferase [Planctomycetaceae bacterium]